VGRKGGCARRARGRRTRGSLLCDECTSGYHMRCLTPPLAHAPDADEWLCPVCEAKHEDIGNAVIVEDVHLQQWRRRGDPSAVGPMSPGAMSPQRPVVARWGLAGFWKNPYWAPVPGCRARLDGPSGGCGRGGGRGEGAGTAPQQGVGPMQRDPDFGP